MMGFVEILCIYLLVELIFWIYIRFYLHPKICILNPIEEVDPTPIETMNKICESLKDIQHVYSIEKFIMGWCLGAKTISDCRDGNIKSFLIWAFYGKAYNNGIGHNKNVIITLNKLYNMLECNFPIIFNKIQQGYNPDLQHARMSLTKDIHILHRPLVLYILVRIIEYIASVILLSITMGFRKYYINTHNMKCVYNDNANIWAGASVGADKTAIDAGYVDVDVDVDDDKGEYKLTNSADSTDVGIDIEVAEEVAVRPPIFLLKTAVGQKKRFEAPNPASKKTSQPG